MNLRRGLTANGPVFDREGLTIEGFIKLRPRALVLVEGFLLFYERRIRDLFDFKISVDIADETTVERRLQRSRSESSKELYYREVVVKEFRRFGLPARKHADLIADGNRPLKRIADDILGRLEEAGILQ